MFGDCAVNVSPSAGDLALIAISCADTAAVFGIGSPKVAMLSYSTGAHQDTALPALHVPVMEHWWKSIRGAALQWMSAERIEAVSTATIGSIGTHGGTM